MARAGLLSMLALAALGGTRLIHGSIVSRATDHDTYALVGTLIGVAMTAGLFLPAGLASAASKFIAYERGAGRLAAAGAAYRGLARAGLAVALGFGLAVGLGASASSDVSPADALATGALTVAFSLYSVAKGALYGFDRVPAYVRLELACSLLAILSTVVIVASGRHGYLWPLTLGYGVLAAVAWWTLRGSVVDGELAGPRRREIAGFVGLASVGAVASAGLLQLLPLIASRFTSPVEVSFFVAAVTLVAPLYFLPRALGLALFPAMAHAHGAGDAVAVRRQLDLSTRALLVLLAPVFIAAVLLAREVLVVFGGLRYAGGAAVLQVILLATYVTVVQVAAVNALSSGARREVRIPVRAAVVGCVVGLVAAALLGRWVGAAGVATAYLLGVSVTAVLPMAAVWRRYEMSWTRPAVRSLAAVALAFVAARLLEWTPESARVLVDVVVALAATAVVVSVLWRDISGVLAAARSPSMS